MIVLVITLRADFGGGPEHVYQLVKNAASVCFYIACPDDVPYADNYKKLVGDRMFLLPHRKFQFYFLLKLIAYTKKNKIDVIHSHGKGAGLYARGLSAITGIPSLHTPHGIHVGEYNTLKKTLYKLYENVTARWIRKILFVSSSEKKKALGFGLWPRVMSTVIPNGVSLVSDADKKMWRHSVREKLLLGHSQFVVTMISRFDYAKNMREAFEIAKQCPEVCFIWVGDGEDKSLLEALSESEGVSNIIYVGFSDEPKHYLAAGDLYLSTSRWEGLPLGMLEAMSLGLPVIASKVSGNVDLVQDGETGFLYPLGSVGSAVKKITLLMRNRDLCRQQGAAARSRQQKIFNVKNMAYNIADEYVAIVRG